MFAQDLFGHLLFKIEWYIEYIVERVREKGMSMYVVMLLLSVSVCVWYMVFRGGKGIERKIEVLYRESVELQRNGKLREYGEVMKEIRELEGGD